MASEVELLEVFRLAEAAGTPDIVRVVEDRLAASWMGVSRFRDVLAVTDRSRRIQRSAGTLLWAGRAKHALGDTSGALTDYQRALPICREVGDRAGEAATLSNIGGVYDRRGDGDTALDYYQRALPICREVGDRAGEAATLSNIGAVYDGRGDGDTALDYYQRALPICREVGDRAGEAVTRYNIAMVYRGAGRLADAVAELEVVVELDRAVQHPDLAADTAVLAQIQAQLYGSREA